MKKIIRNTAITVVAIMFTLLAYMTLWGFCKVSDAFIGEYSISEDGSQMTIQVGVSGSIGFVRSVKVSQQSDGILFLDCYSAFGGINGRIGANDGYTIHINEDTNIIALYRNNNHYEIILKKDESGNWQRAGFGNYVKQHD